ncbi:hypothetical protein [Helicobacter ailurogastricus]|uniref:hypothetical protein n=1 Tax=Helicobacter ailurogastricus TaxID=1578720 RepID=UPI0018D1C065|nr:hypothetical protein [Helicobacter ailurogastricus]
MAKWSKRDICLCYKMWLLREHKGKLKGLKLLERDSFLMACMPKTDIAVIAKKQS